MGDTKTDHHKPENVRELNKAAGELPAWITKDGQHVIVKLGKNWHTFQRTTVGVFKTRRAAADHVANPNRIIA